MSAFPEFATLDLGPAPAARSVSGEAWETPEGIAVRPAYSAADVAGLDFLQTWPGLAPFLRRRAWS